MDPLAVFSPRVADWFRAAFAAPTAAQERAWPAIATGEHVLLSAPTGSHRPDILITTPESLYLMLTSQAREIFADVEAVIVDEIHAVASTKRGSHLALTLERLTAQAGREVQRIGLSATQNPLEEVGRFLVGPHRACTVVDAGIRKPLELEIRVPVESMVEPDQPVDLDPLAGGEATRRSIWPAIYPQILQLVQQHRSTIVFVNNRRGAERLAL